MSKKSWPFMSIARFGANLSNPTEIGRMLKETTDEPFPSLRVQTPPPARTVAQSGSAGYGGAGTPGRGEQEATAADSGRVQGSGPVSGGAGLQETVQERRDEEGLSCVGASFARSLTLVEEDLEHWKPKK